MPRSIEKQALVSLPTMEAEYAVLCEVLREVIYVKWILKHMGFEKYVTSPINVFSDNQNAIKLSKNAVCHKCNKHINIRNHFIRELMETKLSFIIYKFSTSGYPHQGITEM